MHPMTTAIDPLNEARLCYERALMLSTPLDVRLETQHGLELLGSLETLEADRLRLQLMDVEIQVRSGAAYTAPSPEVCARFRELSDRLADPIYQARALHYWGIHVWSEESFSKGAQATRQAMDALQSCHDVEGQLHATGSLGLFTSVTGDLFGGIALMHDGLQLYDQLPAERRKLPIIQINRVRVLLRMALNLFDIDEFEPALNYFHQARIIYEQLGQPYACTTEYAQFYARVGFWSHADYWCQQAIDHAMDASSRAYSRIIYSFVLAQQNKIAPALVEIRRAMDLIEHPLSTHPDDKVEPWVKALGSNYYADLLILDGPDQDLPHALELADQGFRIGDAAFVHYGSIYGLMNKARIALLENRNSDALELMTDAVKRLRDRENFTLLREEEVLYWYYRTLQATGQDGQPALQEAYERLERAASRMQDAQMRQSFLYEVPLHRTIVELIHPAEPQSKTNDER